MQNNYSRGFTLIELLVVIAIIGILSAVVLASLNTARTKGNDAAVSSNMATIQVQAELYYDDNANAYGVAQAVGDCPASGDDSMFGDDATIAQAITAIDNVNGGANGVTCGSDGANAYMVASPLPGAAADPDIFCIDSTGFKGAVDAVPADLTCN